MTSPIGGNQDSSISIDKAYNEVAKAEAKIDAITSKLSYKLFRAGKAEVDALRKERETSLLQLKAHKSQIPEDKKEKIRAVVVTEFHRLREKFFKNMRRRDVNDEFHKYLKLHKSFGGKAGATLKTVDSAEKAIISHGKALNQKEKERPSLSEKSVSEDKIEVSSSDEEFIAGTGDGDKLLEEMEKHFAQLLKKYGKAAPEASQGSDSKPQNPESTPEIFSGEVNQIPYVIGKGGEALNGSVFTRRVHEQPHGVLKVTIDGKEAVFKGLGKDPRGRLLGTGAEGRAYIGQKEHSGFVIKMIKVKEKEIDKSLKEGEIMAFFSGTKGVISSSHRFVMHASDLSDDCYVGIVMENYDRGELLDIARDLQVRDSYTYDDVKSLVQVWVDAVDGLGELHAQDYLHRDIKPANIFVKTERKPELVNQGIFMRGVLGDLGFTKKIYEIERDEIVGTPGYAAPEIFTHRESERFTAKSDVFAAGASLFEAFTGGYLFENTLGSEFHREVREKRVGTANFVHLPVPREVQKKIAEIVKNTTTYDAESRWTVEQLKQGMQELQEML